MVHRRALLVHPVVERLDGRVKVLAAQVQATAERLSTFRNRDRLRGRFHGRSFRVCNLFLKVGMMEV
eukprot:scaffold1070_cov245-Pinguiococcus_pyrenoidosus.AAC.20